MRQFVYFTLASFIADGLNQEFQSSVECDRRDKCRSKKNCCF